MHALLLSWVFVLSDFSYHSEEQNAPPVGQKGRTWMTTPATANHAIATSSKSVIEVAQTPTITAGVSF